MELQNTEKQISLDELSAALKKTKNNTPPARPGSPQASKKILVRTKKYFGLYKSIS